MLEQEQSTPSPVTIDEAFKALKHWRENKGDYSSPGIPNEVWLQILQLEDNGYSASELKRIFNLSSTQYATRKTNSLMLHLARPQLPNRRVKAVMLSVVKAT